MSTESPTAERRNASIPSVGLGTHSARALVYFFACSSTSKVFGLLTQLALLYYLDKTDFGVVTMALTVTSFIQLIGQSGVLEVLVRRRAFRAWAIPGFWLALTLGILSSFLIIVSAPIAAWVYGDNEQVRQQLIWLLLVLAPSTLPFALSVVPQAQLLRKLQFQTLATINLINITLQNVLMVSFAALGLGPYSLVIPVTVGGFVATAIFWWWVRPPFAMQLRLRRWRYMVGDAGQLLGAEYGRLLIEQSDYMLLGLFYVKAIVGIYTVGFRFSIQTMQLLMTNMSNILFPTFMKLSDRPQQQFQAFFKVQRILAMVGVSSCFLQAATAAPFAQLLFPAKWAPSIIVMQILSLGMATRMISGASQALLKSQGRFRTVRRLSWAYAIAQVITLSIVLLLGGGYVAVSIAVAVLACLAGPIMFYVAIRHYNAGWAEVGAVLVRPLVCGTLSVGTAWLIAQSMAAQGYGNLSQLVVTVVVAVALNLLLARLWMRPVWDDFWIRVRRVLPQRAVATTS